MRKSLLNTNTKNRIFDVSIITITTFAVILCIMPIINVAATSLSSKNAVISRKVWLWPVEFTLKAYQGVFGDQTFINSLFFTIGLTLICTVVSLVMTILCAYPLTKKGLKGRKVIMTMIIITMYFHGGIIPDYLLMQRLDWVDKIWVLILPASLQAFYLIILKSFFMSIPESLEESAYLDGASHWVILTKIVLPLSKPVLATLALFYAVGRWNGFQDVIFYITNPKLQTIQFKLYNIIRNFTAIEISRVEGLMATEVMNESMQAACIMIATVPILVAYPFLQRYFLSGVMIGAIKE